MALQRAYSAYTAGQNRATTSVRISNGGTCAQRASGLGEEQQQLAPAYNL